jgi:hypothetical protein
VLIRRGLERNHARIAFPRAMTWGLLLLSVLPPQLAGLITASLGFGARKRQRTAVGTRKDVI